MKKQKQIDELREELGELKQRISQLEWDKLMQPYVTSPYVPCVPGISWPDLYRPGIVGPPTICEGTWVVTKGSTSGMFSSS